MKNRQTQKNKRDFSKPQKIRISKITDPKIIRAPLLNFFSSTLPGDQMIGSTLIEQKAAALFLFSSIETGLFWVERALPTPGQHH